MLTAADVGLVTNVMKGINAPESLIQSIRTLLTTNSDGLGGTKLVPVGTSHFGGSTNGHRLGVNAQMAHQEAEQEFQKLADSLRGYLYLRMHVVDWEAVGAAALTAALAEGDALGEASARLSLGTLQLATGRYDDAIASFAAARGGSRLAGWPAGESAALANLGNVHLECDRLDEAAEHYAEALELNRRHGLRNGEAGQLANLALVQGIRGQLQLSADNLGAALALHRQIGSRVSEARNLANLGHAYHRLGRLADATAALTRALAMHRELGDDRLARTGRGGDQHAATGLQGLAGRQLEVVEGELDPPAELLQARRSQGAGAPGLGRRIPFGGRERFGRRQRSRQHLDRDHGHPRLARQPGLDQAPQHSGEQRRHPAVDDVRRDPADALADGKSTTSTTP